MILLDTNICIHIINARPAAVLAHGEQRAELERRGTPIGSLDTMIAAHALREKAPLVTHNTRTFARVPAWLKRCALGCAHR